MPLRKAREKESAKLEKDINYLSLATRREFSENDAAAFFRVAKESLSSAEVVTRSYSRYGKFEDERRMKNAEDEKLSMIRQLLFIERK